MIKFLTDGLYVCPTNDGFAICRVERFYDEVVMTQDVLFYGPSVEACEAWWAIEKSNEPAPSGFDVYAQMAQMAKMVTPYTDIDQFFKLMQAAKS